MKNTPNSSFIDNTEKLKKIVNRLNGYSKFTFHSLKNGLKPKELIANQFPFWFNDFSFPPIITVELTNVCNLQCSYCDSPLSIRTKGIMKEEVSSKLISHLQNKPARRIRIVGTGEPTLHKNFDSISKKLISNSKYVSIVTNGHWEKPDLAKTIANLGFGMVEFSVDAGNEEQFKKSRKGELSRVIDSINNLRSEIKKAKSNTIINVRVMIRPSLQKESSKYIKKYNSIADTAIPQLVTLSRNFEYQEDVFFYVQKKENSIPKCALPFKDLEIRYNGDVLLCGPSSRQIGEPGMVAGNILANSIEEIWTGEVFSNYRKWHRAKQEDKLDLCRGCYGF